MGKIFCIIGKSSTGKDTLYQRILERKDLQLRQIVSYTTRPIRAGEVDGTEYHFCTHEKKDALLASGKVIEIRSYHTCHGIWDYFTVDDGNIDLEKNNYLVIGTIASFVKLRDYFSEDAVLPIYIEVEDGIRLQRALDRERCQMHPKYEEMCRRFLADASDFSKEKLQEAGIHRIFYNEDLERTEEQIVCFMREVMMSEEV
ncbi:MAG: guanylate kinase [Lachnospiraceae bacterium]